MRGEAENGVVAATLEHVTLRFATSAGSVTALDDVSFELRDGELLVLVGRSGSGKTTALNVLAGLAQPTEGRATVLGRSPLAARDELGYMFARDALLPWRTARRNVEFALELRGVPRHERLGRALQHLRMVGLERLAGNLPGQLSQGQRQRVALARTLAPAPRLLMMDEPFSALDAQNREELQEQLLALWSQDRRSIVFVTHDLNEAITLADRILVFGRGKVVREFVVPLKRPRDLLDLTANQDALEIYREIRAFLHE